MSLKKQQISTLEVVRLHACHPRCLLGGVGSQGPMLAHLAHYRQGSCKRSFSAFPPVSLHLPVSPQFLKHVCADCWEAGAGPSELSCLLWPLLFYWPVNISFWHWQHYSPWGLPENMFCSHQPKLCDLVTLSIQGFL